MDNDLFEKDWRFILDAVLRINSMRSVEFMEREVLECLQVLIPCTQLTFFVAEQGEDNSPLSLTYKRPVVVGQPARFMDKFLDEDFNRDPYFRGMAHSSKTETFRDTDLMPEEYRVNSRIYQEIYAPQGIHYALRSYLVHNGKPVGNISLFNSKEAGDFGYRSTYVLDLLSPHVARKLGELLENEKKCKADEEDPVCDKMAKYALTPREQEIVLSILSGEDDKDIASKLCISHSTFKKHLYNVYRKLDVSNRVQLYAAFNETM